MTRRAACAGALVAGLIAVATIGAQRTRSTDAEVRAFVARARAATRSYADRDAAARAGYRQVGVDFPAMGEHWVSLPEIMADTFDAARPAVLTYVTVSGRPRLVGVGYTALLEQSEALPAWAPARPHWHEHNGSVDDESLPRALGGDGAPDGGWPHLAVLHAWVWQENPAGVFATDNWTLPYLRVGLPPRATAPPELAGALALGAGLTEYYVLATSRGAQAAPVRDAIGSHAAALRELVARAHAAGALAPDVERSILARWEELWRDVVRAGLASASDVERLRRGAASDHRGH